MDIREKTERQKKNRHQDRLVFADASGDGEADLIKLEILVRELSDLKNQGKDVVLVSSGAIMVGRNTLGFSRRPERTAEKQACASVGRRSS